MVTKKSIEAKFRRAGVSFKQTFLWLDIQEELKFEIKKNIIFLENESCIVCFYSSKNYILLLTTLRIIMYDEGIINYYPFQLINDITLDDIFDTSKTKFENKTVNLVLKSGIKIAISVEQGTWHIWYNIFKLVTSKANIR